MEPFSTSVFKFIRQVSCYTLLSGFRLPWPPSCCLDELTPFVVSDERVFRHLNLAFGSSRIASSAYQKWPTRNSHLQGNFGRNQLLDGSISLSPLYPNLTIDLHVRIATSLHQIYHPNTCRHVRLLGPCFKTGHLKPLCQHKHHRSMLYHSILITCFSSFPHGTCSLSVSRQYLALEGIYLPF
ncbi:hypothetical protein BS47DRAFT_1374517 [Hydnum rufescens UP504]|uniref:Uncharacterized protein n=1 Tax=Hydnum rufescens UP504 TaxID=1448309 RepID=A0A9P6AB47_9AGAM|nr:hypothetical protein BS47DRAFT_1374517 [Hydnum rufescens UP504]